MASDRQIALAKLRSLRHALLEGITELEVRAAAAAEQGLADVASQSSLHAVTLAKETVRLRKAEDAIRATVPITEKVNMLSALADDARKTAQDLRSAADLLAATTHLLNIFRRLVP